MTAKTTIYDAFRRDAEQAASAWFENNGTTCTQQHPYIPAGRKRRKDAPIDGAVRANMLNPSVVSVLEERARSQPFALHGHAHNGLSSQAMLFNLVGRLVKDGDIDAMRAAFDAAGAPWPQHRLPRERAVEAFEYEDRAVFNERQSQPTSIDLVIGEPAKPGALYVEAKFVEREFGACSQFRRGNCDGGNPLQDVSNGLDACPLHKLGRTYWRRLQAVGADWAGVFGGDVCPMAHHYQFYRQVAFAHARDGHLVLLVDARNPRFLHRDEKGQPRGLWPMLRATVPASFRPRLHYVTIQSVVAAIRQTGRHGDWIEEFARKYAIDAAAEHPDPDQARFENGVLAPVRQYLGHARIRVPSGVRWRFRSDEASDAIVVALDHRDLGRNMQQNVAAAPSFAVCLAYWLTQATARPCRVEVHIAGDPPKPPTFGRGERRKKPTTRWLHWQRSQLLLHIYSEVLGDRFSVVPRCAWSWPTEPRLNHALGDRAIVASQRHSADSEHHLEVAITRSGEFAAQFASIAGEIDPLERQLPLGLFDGEISAATAWTPGGGSQADLWTTSRDGAVAHIFELKVARNRLVGIVPELICYAWLLRHVAAPIGTHGRIEGEGVALGRIAGTERLDGWLLAKDLHPLVFSRRLRQSPLAWFNEGLAERGITANVLPLTSETPPTLDLSAAWGPSVRR